MTYKEIKIKLKNIYEEMTNWSRLNALLKGPLPQEEVRRRELVLLKQQLLYKIEDAKKEKDKTQENFNCAIYKSVTNFLQQKL